MESHRQLDAPRGAAIQHTITSLLIVSLLASALIAQGSPSEAQIEKLFQQERWQEIVNAAPPLGVSPQIDLDYGIALARLEKWQDAEAVLRDGLRLRPNDARFAVELAGVAFKQGKLPNAQSWLGRAIRITPRDEYSLDFFATVFYLQGNLEAALKYWNRIGKPRVENVISEPIPQLRPVLLDRAFAFSPASTLQLANYKTTQARIAELDLFSSFRIDLQARAEGKFDAVFDNSERNGCGGNKWSCLLNTFGDSPAQTLNFNYFNIGNEAVNVRSSFRWDAEKRRVIALVEAPLAGTPKWHAKLGTDLRNENWGVLTSFSGPAQLLGALNLKREAVTAQFTDVMSGRWQWSAEAEFSERQYHNVLTGVLSRGLLTPGAQLKESFSINSQLITWPERRLTLDGQASLSVARLWSAPGRDFAKLQSSAILHWFPQHSREKYEIQERVRAGKTFGDPPFDELYMLGVLGDIDLNMKAHIATRDGKKGSAPMGRNYFLSNWEATRNFSPLSLAIIKVGPFVDAGKITDPIAMLGSHKWLWDVGVEAKVQVMGFGVVFSYGKDLRSGRNAFVVSTP